MRKIPKRGHEYILCFWTGFTPVKYSSNLTGQAGFYGSFLYFSLEEGLHFFAFHPRFKRDRLERQKNHVYHVNPWPRPGIENTVFIIEFS